MKTILEWYQELPEPYRTQAIENCEHDLLDMIYDDIQSAIGGGFLWGQTEVKGQGWDYWKELSDRYE